MPNTRKISVPRKFLAVKNEPPKTGFVIMMEASESEQTLSFQVPEDVGEEVIRACMRASADVLIRRGYKSLMRL